MNNHPNRGTAIIIVNDGQYRWGADRHELIAAMERMGWTREGSRWTEPATSGDPTEAYTDLCQAVQPLPGYDPEQNSDAWDILPTLTTREDMGHGVWLYSAA